jgi:hypothetical protein
LNLQPGFIGRKFSFINGFVFFLDVTSDKLLLTCNIKNNLGAMLVEKKASWPCHQVFSAPFGYFSHIYVYFFLLSV